MSLVKLLPAWLHAVADYAVALSLIVVALVVGGPGKAVAAGVVIGAVVLVVSLLTKYPLGLIKVLPFGVHSAGDYLAAALLVASPFVLKFNHSARGLSIFYIGAGVAVALVSLITNYQYGPQAKKTRKSAAADDSGDANRWLAAAAKARQPAYPPQGAAQSPSETDEPAYAYDRQAAPQRSYGLAPAPVEATARAADSRPLREILAERRATGKSAA
jgi:hypothetical protein